QLSRPHRYPHSSPTRRSSDLFERQNITESNFRASSATDFFMAVAALKMRAPSRCAGRPSSCAPSQISSDTSRGKIVPPARSSPRSEEHTSELQSLTNLVCRLL